MATYPIFETTGGQRIAVNPNAVARIVEIEPQNLMVYFNDGESINVAMALENAVAILLGNRPLAAE